MALSSLESSILATVAYADVFSFPLSEAELWYYFYPVQACRLNKTLFRQSLTHLIERKYLRQESGYITFYNQTKSLVNREKSEKYTQAKVSFSKFYASILFCIPSILFIGISGSVAAHNAVRDDDIDFIIICEQGTIWATRFLVYFVLKLLNSKRKRNEDNPNNKICTNFFITNRSLSMSKNRRNIYTAHEIANILPLFDRNNTYQQFWANNAWVHEFLPHVKNVVIETDRRRNATTRALLRLLNPIVKYPQIWYMHPHLTNETITDDMLAFHPRDAMSDTLKAFNKILTQLH